MEKSTLKSGGVFLLVLFAAMIVGALFGFGYALLEINGQFVKWKEIEAPPEQPSKILLIDADQIWVQTSDGNIFWNPSSSECETNCWSLVNDLSMQPTLRYDEPEITPISCAAPPMIFNIMDRRDECERTPLYAFSRVYVIKSNGQLMAWKAYTGSEWDLLTMALHSVTGLLLSLVIGLPLAIYFAYKTSSKFDTKK
jgi:hypothetical protein